MKAVVCTLFEGHYQVGAGALVNSLHAAGFPGRIVCGHRGDPPPWAGAARGLPGGPEVVFVRLGAGAHLTYQKPEFMIRCWAEHGADAGQLHYLDPDIVLKAPWEVLERWSLDGIALCEDVNGALPARHPYRLLWGDFLRSRGLEVARPLDRYYNAGYVGLPREAAPFLRLWADIVAEAGRALGDLTLLKNNRPHSLFHSADQDALNMALMCSQSPINPAGPEGMDFAPGGHLLSHAIGGPKPWKGGFLANALRGRPPGSAQKSFFRHAERPLRLLATPQLARLRLSLALGALVGRVYRRG